MESAKKCTIRLRLVMDSKRLYVHSESVATSLIPNDNNIVGGLFSKRVKEVPRGNSTRAYTIVGFGRRIKGKGPTAPPSIL